VDSGHLFTLAAGKAAALRGRFGPLQSDFWPFVDGHNGEFAQAMRGEDVARWNTPSFPELIPTSDTAQTDADAAPTAHARRRRAS
jgi:hypothetical protein